MPTYVDPPSGWRYGFPKLYPYGNDFSRLREWFLSEGYPKENIELAMMYSRYLNDVESSIRFEDKI